MSFEDVGLDLTGGSVRGHSKKEIWERGICACGHRVAAHDALPDGRAQCRGVSKGKRLYRTQMETDCVCVLLAPVVLVKDTRPFRMTWRSAMPEHPLNATLARVGAGAVIDWLVETPLVCQNPRCARVGGVRAAYAPGTLRQASALLCDGPDSAPVENGV